MARSIDSIESIGKDSGMSCVDEVDLHCDCGALIQDWDRGHVEKNFFEVMQSHEEEDAGDRRLCHYIEVKCKKFELEDVRITYRQVV